MTSGQATTPIENSRDVLALLERQRELLRAALQVGVEVEGVIARGEVEKLEEAIERRGKLVAELRGMDGQVRAAGEWLAVAGVGEREEVLGAAQEVARLRERVVEQVRGQERAIRATKAKLNVEAEKVRAGGAAVGAYRAKRLVAARFMDRKG